MIRGLVALWALCWVAAFAAPPAIDREQMLALIKQRYPQLLEHRMHGTPVVIALIGPDGRIARTALEIRPAPAGAVTASEGQFARFGLKAPLRYVGLERIELTANTVVIVLGGLSGDLDSLRP